MAMFPTPWTCSGGEGECLRELGSEREGERERNGDPTLYQQGSPLLVLEPLDTPAKHVGLLDLILSEGSVPNKGPEAVNDREAAVHFATRHAVVKHADDPLTGL